MDLLRWCMSVQLVMQDRSFGELQNKSLRSVQLLRGLGRKRQGSPYVTDLDQTRSLDAGEIKGDAEVVDISQLGDHETLMTLK